MATLYKTEDFADALAKGPVMAPIALVGLVKSADNRDSILFAPEIGPIPMLGVPCDSLSWIPISTDIIDSVEVLGKVSCGEKTYNRVRLVLKRELGGPVGVALLTLLQSYVDAATTQSSKTVLPVNMSLHSVPLEVVGSISAERKAPTPNALSFYYFMLTQPGDPGYCGTLQVQALSPQQAFNFAQATCTNCTVTSISYSQFIQGCPY